MADLSDIAQNIENSLANGDLVEEYRVGTRMVRRGKPTEQVDALIKLKALAHRQANGTFLLPKLRSDP